MSASYQPKPLLWLLILAVIGFAVHFAGLKGAYFGDDYMLILTPISSDPIHWWFHRHPFNPRYYRPIESSVLTVIQSNFGLNTLPVHLTVVSIHIMLSWLVYLFMTKSGFSRLQALLGSVFMLASQTNTNAVLCNFGLSQVCAGLFGAGSLWLLHSSYLDTPNTEGGNELRVHRIRRLFSVLCFLLALLSKETSPGIFIAILGLILYRRYRMSSRSSAAKQVILEILPYLAMMALYLSARLYVHAARPSFGSDVYNFHIGSNVLRNLVLFGLGASTPLSSVTTYVAFQARDIVLCSLILASILGFATAVFYGVWHSEQRRVMVFMGVFAFLSLFPVMFLNHVGELYLYSAMPFVAVIVGVGLGRFLEIGKQNRAFQGVRIGLVGLLILSNIVAIQSKAYLLWNNGERATNLFAQITPYVLAAPQDGNIVLLQPQDKQVDYSKYLLDGFDVLKYGLPRINLLSGRKDVKISIVEFDDMARYGTLPNSLVLELDNDIVRKYHPARPKSESEPPKDRNTRLAN
jgi:hypothetical protein